MLRITSFISVVLIILEISAALSQLHGIVGEKTLGGSVVSVGTNAVGKVVPAATTSSEPKPKSDDKASTNLTAEAGSRSIGGYEKTYRKPKEESNTPKFGTPIYAPKNMAKSGDDENDEDDIIDGKSLKSSSRNQGGRMAKGREENLRKTTEVRKSSSESSEETTTLGPVRKRSKKKKKRVNVQSAESLMKFVEESEREQSQKMGQSESKRTVSKASRGRSFSKSSSDSEPKGPANSANLPVDNNDTATIKVGGNDSKSKRNRKKVRTWWKKLMFDSDFLSQLDSKSGSGSSEKNKPIWLNKNGKGSPSVLIIPQRVYEIDYKVYREGNRQKNIYNTNITPSTSDGNKNIKIIQSPVQISKDHLGKDTQDDLKWPLSSNESTSGSTESTSNHIHPAGRSMKRFKGLTLSDLLNETAAERNNNREGNSEKDDTETVQSFKDKFKGSKRRKQNTTDAPKSFETTTLPSLMATHATVNLTTPTGNDGEGNSEKEDAETVQKFKDKFKSSKRKKPKTTVSPITFKITTLPSLVTTTVSLTTPSSKA